MLVLSLWGTLTNTALRRVLELLGQAPCSLQEWTAPALQSQMLSLQNNTRLVLCPSTLTWQWQEKGDVPGPGEGFPRGEMFRDMEFSG